MVNVTIDGKKIEVPEGTTVLQAAKSAGVEIPTLCDHPHLHPYGGCRLCLVEVEGVRTLQPSCTLPVNNNMVVHTDTTKVEEARKFVLTLIFSERNHFCMYCQKSGGDCELQNCAYAQGMTHWPLQPNWQPYPVDASHPDFVMDHNRCILCRRCVRACGELVGNFTLGFEERGANSFLVADLGTPLGESSCVSCGTCVQICPTGALIDRKSAYMGHEVQVENVKSTCVGCSAGCGVNLAVRDNQVLRIDGDWDAPVSEGLLCELGRFKPLTDERERIVTPLVRKGGSLKAATWDEALAVASDKLASLSGKNGSGVVAFASSRLPAEALTLFKQVFGEKFGAGSISSLEDGAAPSTAKAFAKELGRSFEGKLDQLKTADFVLTIGTDLAADHQVAGFFVKRNLPQGTALAVVDSGENKLAASADYDLKVTKNSETDLVLGLTAAVSELGLAKEKVANLNGVTAQKAAASTGVSADTITAVARKLASAKNPVIVYGRTSLATLKALAGLASAIGAFDAGKSALVSIKGAANSLAAAQLGLDQPVAVQSQQAAFVAVGDDTPSQRLVKTLESVPFLVVQASYASPLTARADVVLPVEMWAEQAGHYVSLDGRVLATQTAVKAPEGILSNQKAFEMLAGKLGVKPQADWAAALRQTTPAVAIGEN